MSTIQTIPLENLRESPFNPRKTYPEADLLELAESIKSQGVMQPIVVRVIPESVNDLYFRYEIVFGHRRFRAAALAGEERIPSIVREYTDLEAAVAQLHENAKRQDVTAIEEADSFLNLVQEHRMSADDVAKAAGKSRSHVYAQLRLAKAAPELRKAVTEQGLSPELARKVATRPHHDQQRAGLKLLRESYRETAESPIVWASTRDGNRSLANAFNCSLDDASFDLDDLTLAARAGACTNCPKRAANNPDLESLPPNTCLDKKCFEVKEMAQTRLRMSALEAQGHYVVQGAQAQEMLPNSWTRQPEGMTRLQDKAYEIQGDNGIEWVTYEDIVAKMTADPLPVHYVLDPHAKDVPELKAFITDKQASALRRAAGHGSDDDDEGASTPSTAAQARGDVTADWSAAEKAATDSATWLRVRKAVLLRLINLPRSLDELRGLALRELEINGDFDLMGDVMGLAEQADAYGDESTWYEDWVKNKASADELGALVAGMVIDDGLGTYVHVWGGRPEEALEEAKSRVALAERYGVDVAGVAGADQTVDAGAAGEVDAQVDAFEEQSA